MKKLEKRTFNIDLRSEESDGVTKIVGRAIVFNSVSNGEMVHPGALSRTLKNNKDIRAYWQHNTAIPLGRQGNDTLKLKVSKEGLDVEIMPNPDTTWGRDALASVARGDVNAFSFGFIPVLTEQKKIDGEDIRVLKEIQLFEVSPVSEPWYPATVAEARDLDSQCDDGPSPSEPHLTRIEEAKRIQKAGTIVEVGIIAQK